MRLAIIGTGISGIAAACMLHRKYEVTLFEAEARLGGHAHTVTVEEEGKALQVDTGFIVYNEVTYPNFCRLLDRYKVPTQPSDMSFSVKCRETGLEYGSKGFGCYFADRKKLLSSRHWRMLGEIFRFNREAIAYLERGDTTATLDEFLSERRHSKFFRQYYVEPLLAAIWSAAPGEVGAYPAAYFLNFFRNHGLLGVNQGHQWRVIKGGSRSYVDAFTEAYRDRVRLSTPVRSIERFEDGVQLQTADGNSERFDQVIVAVHSDIALKMLSDASGLEREILSAMSYRENDVVLHTDESLLPVNRNAWASWNYEVGTTTNSLPTLTYDMNRLQGLGSRKRYLVSLNSTGKIAADKVLGRYSYAHPVYTAEGITAQRRHAEISGQRRTHFCGAYWGYGFHEDGVNSAVAVAKYFGAGIADA
ncbi:MAG: 15-cis-phytoene desaturase [Candidatus Hydrogenedentota bacterium]